MGRALCTQHWLGERASRGRLALLGDVEAVRERVTWPARDAGFRGAALLDEPGNRSTAAAPPPRATILAPRLTGICNPTRRRSITWSTWASSSTITGRTPAGQITEPQLHYSDADLHNEHGQLITNAAVNARRSVQELAVLAREAWARADCAGPLLAITDGPLLFWVEKDVPDYKQLEAEHLGWQVNLHDLHANRSAHGESASLLGYVDRPASTFLIGLLHLMSLDAAEVREPALKSNGDLEGLTDQALLFRLLKPGERSALLVQTVAAQQGLSRQGRQVRDRLLLPQRQQRPALPSGASNCRCGSRAIRRW